MDRTGANTLNQRGGTLRAFDYNATEEQHYAAKFHIQKGGLRSQEPF